MTKDLLDQTLSLAYGHLHTISQELGALSHSGETIDLLLNTLRDEFDKKLQEKPEMLLEQLDQLEQIIDVELMQGAR
jgi:hypothetical protein